MGGCWYFWVLVCLQCWVLECRGFWDAFGGGCWWFWVLVGLGAGVLGCWWIWGDGAPCPLAGCPLLTTTGLSGLVQLQELEELELTNCPGATPELFKYFSQHLPCCMVIE